MQQAIRVHFLGPTNKQPARWVATCAAGRLVRAKEYTNIDEEVWGVACALSAKLGWPVPCAAGQIKDGSYVFVLSE